MSAKKSISTLSRVPAGRFASRWIVGFLLLALVLTNTTELARAWQAPDAAKPAADQSGTARRAFPRISLGEGHQLKYLGMVSPDGKFRYLSKLGKFFATTQPKPAIVPAATPENAQIAAADVQGKEDAIRKQVPPTIELHQHEQPVEDFEPPEHAVQIAKGHSVLGGLRDSVVSLVYGATPILVALESVTTDSQHRVIVTDGGAVAVHVLSQNGKHSFQIVGGPNRRLQSPRGVAVDADDNIYVSDDERGAILVYDSAGEFVRTMGNYGDEGLFENPCGMAIDRKAGHLYVADPPRHAVIILDLKGYLVARVETKEAGFSSRTGSTQPGGFQFPQSVLVHNDELVVLDATRIHILTLQGKFLKEFKVTNSADWNDGPVPGLFMDAENHIYVSDPSSGMIREYSHDGQLLSTFGQPGIEMGQFNALAGMWADPAGRVYIADTDRVQIFQLSGTK
jgi:DNA-binding beta-propeller fold protein YncE